MAVTRLPAVSPGPRSAAEEVKAMSTVLLQPSARSAAAGATPPAAMRRPWAAGSNTANNVFSTVGGGDTNTAGFFSTVGGGYINTASGSYSIVGGGYNNWASGKYSIIAGGASSIASGMFSTVCGGYENTASGELQRRPRKHGNGAISWQLCLGRQLQLHGSGQRP